MKKLLPFILEVIAALLRRKKKNILPLLFVFALSCNQETKEPVSYAKSVAATITVPKNADRAWYYRTSAFPAKPGDVVTLEGDYDYIEIRNLIGTADAPITLKGNGTNRVGFNASNAFILSNCQYIIVEGMIIGGADGKYAEQGFNIQSSANIEIRNCTLQNAKVGFFTNPATGHYPNIFIHHNIIRNISDPNKANFSEAFYIGKTDGTNPSVASYPNLRIEDNTLTDIGGDGIQIANGVNVKVLRNKITNYGFHKINDQWFGILCGGGTSGTFEDNVLTNGMGTPFQILGTGDVTFKGNSATNCAQGANQDGFYIRQSFPTLRASLLGNRIDKVNRAWITQVTPGLVVRNEGNVFGAAPVDPCKDLQTKYDLLQAEYKDLQAEHDAFIKWKQLTLEIFK